MNEKRYRLKKSNKVVGYMRQIGDKTTFYSKDSFWWTGSEIEHDESEVCTFLKDKNRRFIYYGDLMKWRDDNTNVYATVIWADYKSCVLQRVDTGEDLPLFFEKEDIVYLNHLEVVQQS